MEETHRERRAREPRSSVETPRAPQPPAERITHWKGLSLLDFQIQAVEAIRSGANVLVSAPTGAGKTLVAEYAIADAVARGRRCVYTAPIKALSNQKYRDFRDDPEIDVGLMTGDVTIHPSAQVVIMTTEILRNAIFENPAGLHDVDYVIFDEVHFMDDPERGSVWEESLIFAPPEVRFISLSATIANLDQLGAWMNEIRRHPLAVIRSTRRPVPLRHRLHSGPSGVFDLHKLAWVRKKFGESAEGERRRRPRRGRGRGFAPRREREDPATLTTLLDLLQREDQLPALVFSFSRKDCERLAGRNQHRQLLTPPEQERIRELQEELLRLFQLSPLELQGEVFRFAARGVGYHHAGMLPVHKEVIERLFTSGLLKLLFTTETFALGINMPARSVVFSALRKFDGTSFDWLRTREYMQMAGRAGRQGIDSEGLVISHVEARDLEEAPLERILSGKPEPILSRFRLSYSSILHLVERLGPERLPEAWEKSFHQFQLRAKSRKARESNRARQGEVVEAHLALLVEFGYLEEGARTLTGKGRVARLFNGYELVITELLARGILEHEPPQALALVFVGLVFEERRRPGTSSARPRQFAALRRAVDETVREIQTRELVRGIPTPSKGCDWGLTHSVLAWCQGAAFADLEDTTDATPGDLCRTFRMAIQLLRQVRRAVDPRDPFHDAIEAATLAMNRDEVDARRQLELG